MFDKTGVALDSTREDIDVLIDMVMERDRGDALTMVTMLHEIAKLYTADQIPQVTSVVEWGVGPDERLELGFEGRNVRTARNLVKYLNLEKLEKDDDGIPL